MRQCRIGIVNRDDPHTEAHTGHTCSVETFSPAASGGCDGGEYPLFMQSGRTLGSFLVRGKTAVYPVKCRLPGTFNVYNALAAIRRQDTWEPRRAISALHSAAQKVPGRCENVRQSERLCHSD